jgi:hypothetical protein
MNIIKFPIGYWIDGYAGVLSTDFFATSKKPVEDVREAHFKIKDRVGFGIENVCSGRGNPFLKEDQEAKLTELGYFFDCPKGKEAKRSLVPIEVFKIWLFLLNLVDPRLRLVHLEMEKLQSISVDGCDNQGRNLCFLVGCGTL